jgi:hypothetical protein
LVPRVRRQQATKLDPFSNSFAPHVFRAEDKSRIQGAVESDGRFAWSLLPGKYFLYQIAYHDAWSGGYEARLKYAFQVPRAGDIFYVGSLEVEFDSKRDLIGKLSGRVSFAIRDKSDQDLPGIQHRFNLASDEIHKSLMVWNSSLPPRMATSTQVTQAIEVLDAMFAVHPPTN